MRYIVILALLVTGFVACKKTESTVSREDELRSGKWKMIAGTQRWDPAIGPDTVVHYYDSLATCRKDDFLVFGAGRAGTQNAGNKCELSEADAIDFHWYLENNGNKINFYNAFQTFLNQEAVSAPFISYSSSEFTIRYFNLLPNAVDTELRDTVTHTYTFQKF